MDLHQASTLLHSQRSPWRACEQQALQTQHLIPAALPAALEGRMGGFADKPLPSSRLGFSCVPHTFPTSPHLFGSGRLPERNLATDLKKKIQQPNHKQKPHKTFQSSSTPVYLPQDNIVCFALCFSHKELQSIKGTTALKGGLCTTPWKRSLPSQSGKCVIGMTF